MDYSYLNQAAASFDSNCLQNGMDPTGLANMPCSYGDLTSCSQMSQAYRYTAAAASMARSYNPGAGSAVGSVGSAAAMGGLHHPVATGTQCSVMGARSHHQDMHRSSVFSTSMSMQCKAFHRKSIIYRYFSTYPHYNLMTPLDERKYMRSMSRLNTFKQSQTIHYTQLEHHF